MKIKQVSKKTKIEVLFKNKKTQKIKNTSFKGKKGQIEIYKNKIYVGTKKVKTSEDWREIGFLIVKKLKQNEIKEISIKVPKKIKEFVEGMYLGDYEFKKYKTTNNNKEITINLINKKNNLKKIILEAKIITKAQNNTRDWVNTTPEDANSKTIAKDVIQYFKNHQNINVEIYNEEKLKKLKMRGHLAVNRASRHEAKTIKITYIPEKKPEKTIVIIGKGLTYDSGGLSIKPGDSMVSMKSDKAGAMTVLGIMKAIAKLGSKNKIVAYMAMAENMIDGSSYKPDDIIKMKNGKTVHIKNTDAEGRVVLFDNLTLAEEENKKIDEIYTFATLTGAAVYQFGDEAAGMVGFNEKMKKRIKEIGKKEGEIFLNAEFHKYILDSIKDNIADISNMGTYGMGCQKAGLFLTKALKEKNIKKYLHLDIAGPAFIKKPFGTNIEGGTGFGIRTFIRKLKI